MFEIPVSRKTGVLLINVGTPDNPDTASVRKYLAEFLMDKRVVSMPTLLRFCLVYGLILPFRSSKSAHAYQSVWDKNKGSPLLSISQAFAEKLQTHLGAEYVVALGMRYGNPSIASALDALLAQQVDKIIVAPLYPQYASATTSSALEAVFDGLKQQSIFPTLKTIDAFYYYQEYIQAKANVIRPFLKEKWDSILFSYHGLPFAQVKQSEENTPANCDKNLACPTINKVNRNCYRAQCYQTTELLAKALGLAAGDYGVSFQSRVGKNRWIGPDTESALKTLIQQGKKNVLVVCPSFVADCLETLEEIGLRAKELWLSLGGESLTAIPCLNDSPEWVASFAKIILSESIGSMHFAQPPLAAISVTVSDLA
ncbi:MAG: ferrochelatase [Candidatus Berkiella sp.]